MRKITLYRVSVVVPEVFKNKETLVFEDCLDVATGPDGTLLIARLKREIFQIKQWISYTVE
jgi:hypothetical protein